MVGPQHRLYVPEGRQGMHCLHAVHVPPNGLLVAVVFVHDVPCPQHLVFDVRAGLLRPPVQMVAGFPERGVGWVIGYDPARGQDP